MEWIDSPDKPKKGAASEQPADFATGQQGTAESIAVR
jgi:hypothetical protein